jgi:outer membrane lipoprotein-sorting protein
MPTELGGKVSASQTHQALRRCFLLGLAFCCGLAMTAGAQRNSRPASPPAVPTFQNARDILQKSVDVYQSMSSYEGQSNVDTLLLNKKGEVIKQIGTTSKIRFKRPNKLVLEFSTPAGSRSIWSDGSTLVVYDVLAKKYTVGPTAPDITSMLPLLYYRADISASLDPLYNLSKKTLPKELGNVALKESTTFNGHPVYVITGTLTGVKVNKIKGQPPVVATNNWVWWVDRNTFLIHKIESYTQNATDPKSAPPGERRDIIAQTVTLMMRHTITYSKPNGALPDTTFTFKAPPDASQRK